jgi:hypothetical protein
MKFTEIEPNAELISYYIFIFIIKSEGFFSPKIPHIEHRLHTSRISFDSHYLFIF